jgi:hypothetical protein
MDLNSSSKDLANIFKEERQHQPISGVDVNMTQMM